MLRPEGTGRLLLRLKTCPSHILLNRLLLIAIVLLLPLGSAKAALSTASKQLFLAVEINDIGAVKQAIKAGADVNAHDATGMSPADLAVDKGHFIIAHFLLSERSLKKISDRKTVPLKAIDLTRKRVTKTVSKTKFAKHKRDQASKSARFEKPPRKPRIPAEPIDEEVAIASAPGVDAPNGRQPRQGAETQLPLVQKKAQAVGKTTPAPSVQQANSDSVLEPVSSFFQSLVDLVTPDTGETSTPKEVADGATAAVAQSPAPTQSAGQRRSQPRSATPPSDGTASPTLDPNVIQENDTSLFDNLIGETSPETPASPDHGEESSAGRTFDRIKSLLSSDAPREDEFGLPIIDIPPSPTPKTNQAVDTALNQLNDPPIGPNLDDPPGPETGPALVAITAEDQGRQRSLVSQTLRDRLNRLGDALSRTVEVDTQALLQASRKKYAHPQSQDVAKAVENRGDLIAEKVMAEGNKLKPRTTPSVRFSERLAKIRQMEDGREDTHGIPQKSPADGKLPAKGAKPEASQGPSTLDQMADFFTGDRRTANAEHQKSGRVSEAPEYRNAPDSGTTVTPIPNQPDIDNLDAFDQTDETKLVPASVPKQVPGEIPPQFLNRLAGLFNEEGQALEQGWKTTTSSGDGAPLESVEPDPQEQTAWTTTSKLNIGADRPLAIIKVSKSELPVETTNVLKNSDNASGKRQMMANAPYSDPLKAPETQTETPEKTFFSRLTQLFQPKGRDSLPRESLLLEADEKLSTTHDVLKSDVKVASRTAADNRTYWPITELTKADRTVGAERRPNALTRTSLSGTVLTIGDSVGLDNTFPPGENGTDPDNLCVKKNRGTTLFCIEPVDWPEDLVEAFQITTILYTGPRAITRFDQGAATRLHSLFKSEDFEKVTAYYQKRFGEPTEIWKRSIAPLAKPRQDNPTISWRDRDPETNAITILEIRKFDDTRGGFPDTGRGAVMLYFLNSPSIFPQVSAHELMQIKRVAKKTQTEAELNRPPNIDDAPASSEVSPDELLSDPVLPASDTVPSEPAADSVINDAATPSLDELLKAPEDPAATDILDQLNSNNQNDLLENLPGEQPVLN